MNDSITESGGSGARSRPSRVRGPSGMRRWAGLLLGLAAIWGFIFGLAPWLERFEPVGRVTSAVRDSGIDAGAFYYTDVDECAHAERFLRNSLGR